MTGDVPTDRPHRTGLEGGVGAGWARADILVRVTGAGVFATIDRFTVVPPAGEA